MYFFHSTVIIPIRNIFTCTGTACVTPYIKHCGYTVLQIPLELSLVTVSVSIMELYWDAGMAIQVLELVTP